MGVIKGRKGVPITAPNDDGTTPEVIEQFATLDNGVTTDDGGSELEPEIDRQNDGIQSGRIRLFASRRSHLRRQNLRSRHPAIPADTAPPPKVSTNGSKKFRRYENQLELLKECDENEAQEVSIEDLITGTNTARAFTKILKHSNMLELWNKYKEPALEETTNAKSAKKCDGKGASTSGSIAAEFNADEAFQGICRNLRSLLKQRHFPLGMMESLEEDLIAFFMTRPQETFESTPLDAFRRGMIHAVSQYNSLRSHSIKCAEKSNEKSKKVRVHPSEQPFSPPPVRLVEYIENKYHAPPKPLVLSK